MFVSETDSDKWGNLYPGYREILIKLNMKHCTQWYRFGKIFKPRIIFGQSFKSCKLTNFLRSSVKKWYFYGVISFCVFKLLYPHISEHLTRPTNKYLFRDKPDHYLRLWALCLISKKYINYMRYNLFIFSYRLSLICKSIDRWIHVRKTLVIC